MGWGRGGAANPMNCLQVLGMHNTDISVKSTDIGGLVIWVGEEEIQLLGRSVWGSERNDQVFCMILGDFSKIQANDIINIV